VQQLELMPLIRRSQVLTRGINLLKMPSLPIIYSYWCDLYSTRFNCLFFI